MRKLNKKQKVIILVLAFLLITPMVVLYLLNENGVFDTRSSASGVLTEEMAKADLNGDDAITLVDFSIWLSTYRAFKENNVSGYTAMSDLDGDGSIKVSDFVMWLNLWRKYKGSTPDGVACTAHVDCLSGVCSTYYKDADVDGYGLQNSSIKRCGKTTINGYTTNNAAFDCYDSNNNARPNQTACFTVKRGDESFDYNCDTKGDRCDGVACTENIGCKTGACSTFCKTGQTSQTIKVCGTTAPSGYEKCSTNANFGTGKDGVCTVSADTSINTGSCVSSRQYGDAINFSVATNIAAGSSTVTVVSTTATPAGLAVGDEIVIVNLKGTASDYSNVGEYETATIKSISGKVLTLDEKLTNGYDGTTQKIMVQRIPQYTNVTVNAGVNWYPTAWNGSTGGVLMFRATGTVTVKGLIHANGLGYKGGAAPTTDLTGGTGGESFAGTGGNGGNHREAGFAATCGGGGGAGKATNGGAGTVSLGGAGGGGGSGGETGNAGGGGGGGYGGVGLKGYGGMNDAVDGSQNVSGKGGTGKTYPEGVSGGAGGGGGSYGIADLTKLYFGSGGGAGGRGSYYGKNGGKGGNGGGVIYIAAKTLVVTGVISSNGQSGDGGGIGNDKKTDVNGVISGAAGIGGSGGGGAGGSIKLIVDTATLGSSLVKASAGNNGGGTMYGGDGGVGRIRVEYITSITGTTTPTASTVKKN